jgi:hypothetical protein
MKLKANKILIEGSRKKIKSKKNKDQNKKKHMRNCN